MSERENMRQALIKHFGIMHCTNEATIDKTIDFIFQDRKRILQPLVKHIKFGGILAPEYAEKAINKTLTLAGINER